MSDTMSKETHSITVYMPAIVKMTMELDDEIIEKWIDRWFSNKVWEEEADNLLPNKILFLRQKNINEIINTFVALEVIQQSECRIFFTGEWELNGDIDFAAVTGEQGELLLPSINRIANKWVIDNVVNKKDGDDAET